MSEQCYVFLGLHFFLKNVSFHGVQLDALLADGNKDWGRVHQLVAEGIQTGIVRPLDTTIFQRDELEEAFRYMSQGKHIGKVIFQVGICI